jgi:hypothetical protein
LDPIEPEQLSGLFLTIFNKFCHSQRRSDFQGADRRWLISLDGTQHFSSSRIHCDTCHQTEQQDGTVRYSHHLLSPVVIHPDHNQVLSLSPEFMQPQPDHDLIRYFIFDSWQALLDFMFERFEIAIPPPPPADPI